MYAGKLCIFPRNFVDTVGEGAYIPQNVVEITTRMTYIYRGPNRDTFINENGDEEVAVPNFMLQ